MKADWLIQQNNGRPVFDLKLAQSELPSENTVLDELLALHGEDSVIAMRCTRGPSAERSRSAAASSCLFVVDTHNGLGETSVINADLELVASILALIEREAAVVTSSHPVSIPFSDITIGEQIGSGALKVAFAGTWVAKRGVSVCITQQHAGPGIAAELDILRTIGRHPNLVRFYGYSLQLGKCYFVVERAPLGSLHEYLQGIEKSGS
eukprot:gene4-5_t